jgi:hypothetical protein
MSVYTPKILMKLVNFRRLKIGRRSRPRDQTKFKLKLFINHQLIKIKFTLNKIGNWQQAVAVDNGRNGATEHNLDDR